MLFPNSHKRCKNTSVLGGTVLNAIQPGNILSCSLRYFKNITVVTLKPGGQIIRPKLFPVLSAKWDDCLMTRGNYVKIPHRRHLVSTILDFSISPKPQKTGQIDPKVSKTNKEMPKWCKNVKLTTIHLKQTVKSKF